jgi:peptide/nickel transport system permease protein
VSRVRRLATRAGFGVLAAYAVVTVVFVLVVAAGSGSRALTPDALLTWLVDVTTLNWGTSGNTPVTSLVADALPKTLAYVVPAMAVAGCISVLAGLYVAFNPRGVVDRVVSGSAYVAYGIPTFFVGALFVITFTATDAFNQEYTNGIVEQVVWPAGILAASLVAGQLRHVRAQSLEYLDTERVKLVRAKGADRRTLASHVLRNAALPLVSLLFVDLLALVVLEIYVLESVFGIEGIGYLSFSAARNQDLPLVLGTTMVFVFAGVVGSLCQDLAHEALDPRIGEDSD